MPVFNHCSFVTTSKASHQLADACCVAASLIHTPQHALPLDSQGRCPDLLASDPCTSCFFGFEHLSQMFWPCSLTLQSIPSEQFWSLLCVFSPPNHYVFVLITASSLECRAQSRRLIKMHTNKWMAWVFSDLQLNSESGVLVWACFSMKESASGIWTFFRFDKHLFIW